jgi:ubiquinone biosynthesis protein
LNKGWGKPYHDVLEYVDAVPLAAASIGQVHQGIMKNGRHVVIKVCRPDIMDRSEADFAILQFLADVAERRTQWARQYDLSHVVHELVAALRNELDFTVEAHYTALARKHYQGNEERVPEPMRDLTRPDILVLEELRGVKITDTAKLENMGLVPAEIARRYIQVIYHQVFVQGMFHGDPHPGNVHVDRQGRLIFLDWGLVGMFSPVMRVYSLQLVMGLSQGRSEKVVEGLLKMGVSPHHIDPQVLYYDVEVLRRRYYDMSLGNFRIGQAIGDLLQVAQKHHIRMPAEYTLLARTAVIADEVVRQLDDQLSLVEIGQEFAARIVLTRLSPGSWGPAGLQAAQDWTSWSMALPQQLGKVLETLGRGEFHVVLEDKNIDRILTHWEKLVNRILMVFLLMALILGTALVVHREDLMRIVHFPLGEIAFIAALGMALWILVTAVFQRRL